MSIGNRVLEKLKQEINQNEYVILKISPTMKRVHEEI